jgi:hypothetical protein
MLTESRVIVAMGLAGTVLAASLAVWFPRYSIIVIAALALAAVGWSASGRLLLYVTGGLLALGSSAQFDARKLAFLLLAFIVGSVSALHVLSHWSAVPKRWRSVMLVSLFWLAVVLFSSFTAMENGVAITAWLRGAAGYLLAVPAVWVGFDAGSRTTIPRARSWILVSGAVSTVGFVVFYLQARGVGTLGVSYLALPSVLIAALAFAVLVIIAYRRRLAGVWAAAGAIAIVAGVWLTGNRTTLVLPLGLLGAMRWRRNGVIRLRYGLPLLVGLVVVSAAAALLASKSVVIDPTFLRRRLDSLLLISQNGLSSDASGLGRQEAYRLSRSAFDSAPLTGVGPAAGFRGTPLRVETFLLLPAQLGAIGVVAIGVWIVSFWRAARAVVQGSAATNTNCQDAFATARTFAVTVLLLAPFGATFEDKGLSIAICLLTCYLTASLRRGQREVEGEEQAHQVRLPDRSVIHAPRSS